MSLYDYDRHYSGQRRARHENVAIIVVEPERFTPLSGRRRDRFMTVIGLLAMVGACTLWSLLGALVELAIRP